MRCGWAVRSPDRPDLSLTEREEYAGVEICYVDGLTELVKVKGGKDEFFPPFGAAWKPFRTGSVRLSELRAG